MKPVLIKCAINQFGQLVSASETSCLWHHYCVHCRLPMLLVGDDALHHEFFMHDPEELKASPWKVCPYLYQAEQEEKKTGDSPR